MDFPSHWDPAGMLSMSVWLAGPSSTTRVYSFVSSSVVTVVFASPLVPASEVSILSGTL